MASSIKWILVLVVLIALAAGAWYMGLFASFTTTQTTETPTTTPVQATQPPPSDLPTANNDASDAAIGQDAAAIDVQISSLTSDSTSMDQSFNDKPVSQEY